MARDPIAAFDSHPAPHWYRTALVVVFSVGLCVHAAALWDFVAHNPSARIPIGDGGVYWRMAGEIAAGQWQSDAPYHAAPLYPHLLAVVRKLGGGLIATYLLQMVFRFATAWIIARISRKLFDPLVSVLAAGLFLALAEPLFASTRVLNGTLVLLGTTAVWAQLIRLRETQSVSQAAAAGVLLGLLCLAFPPMQLLLMMSAVWLWLLAGRGPRAILSAATLALSAAATIAPATIHNWRACGELIPITAHGGIAFRLGYGEGADGTYNPIPGFTRTSAEQPKDAAAAYERATGETGTPSRIDRHFFRQGFREIADRPGRAIALALRKAYWFATGRYYNDIFQADFEIRRGLGNPLLLAMLPTAWLILPALVALVPTLRHPVRDGPAWMMLFVPLLVVVIFWYSPRYRMPATPVICVYGALALVAALRGHNSPIRAVVAASLAVGIVLGAINRAAGFDSPTKRQPELDFNLGVVLVRQERFEEAAAFFERTLETDPEHSLAAERVAEIRYNQGVDRLREGNPAEAAALFEKCLARDGDHLEALNNLAGLLASNGQLPEAVELYQRATAIDPDSARVENNLGQALVEMGRSEEALPHLRRAVELSPEYGKAHHNLGMVLLRLNQPAEAGAALIKAAALSPDDASLALDVAWLLATHPEAAVRNGAEAVRLAERAAERIGGESPVVWDILAAARAEAGDFEGAVEAADRAIQLAEQQSMSDYVETIRGRRSAYVNRQPCREAPSS